MSRVVHVFTLDLCPHGKIFWTSFGNILPHCKNESTWHWSILEIFGDVVWNMLQRFFFAPLGPFTHSIVHYSLFTTWCSPTSIVFWVTLNFDVGFCNSALKPNISKLDFHTHPMWRWSSHANMLYGTSFCKCVCGGGKGNENIQHNKSPQYFFFFFSIHY